MENMKKEVLKYLFIIIAIVVFFSGIGFGLFYYFSRELPPLSELQSYEMKVGSEIYDRNDNLIHIFYIEKRQLTQLSELPEYLTQGIIAVEDKNFYNHWGMDQLGLIRAIIIDISKGDFSQGASTITQQLARNMFLSLDKQIPRKIKELILAIRIESNFSKDEILEMYLNKSPFGPGLYGIEVGAKKYFGIEAKDLSIPQAALLIGMPQLPSAYYPIRFPERALKRRNIVLRRMLEENVITKEQFVSALETELELFEPTGNFGAKDYFIEFIRRRLENEFGTTQLFTGGMKIYTTLDMDLQEYADSVLNMNLRKFENKNNYEFKYDDFPADTINIVTPYVQGAVFSVEPETGYVRVMIGGRNFNHSKLNRVMQSIRQPGSSFKPILYSTALVNGYTAATIIKDEPFSFIQNDTLFWSPKNYSNKNFGYTRLRTGLKRSRNVYAAKTIYDVDPRKVVEYAERFGITTPIYPYYTLAVGSMEVKPFELITAYTTFPNGGERVKPIYIRRVEDKHGKILKSNEPEKIRVINEQVAYVMADLMQSVCETGTGVGIRWQSGYQTLGSISYKWNAAGKTGTTDDFRDAWFIGYNKKLVTGIWVGFDDNSTLGKGQSGATAALPSWPYIMKKAVYLDSPVNSKGYPIVNGKELQFTKPADIVTVEISKETGLLPKSDYEETMQEIFITGTEPTPLSDSLNYNFYPTFYREHDKDSLVVDLGGPAYVWPDSIILEPTYPDTTRPDHMVMAPRHEPDPIDMRGALIIQNKKIVNRPDSLLWKGPIWLKNQPDSLDAIDKLMDSLIKDRR
ncbi:MAG: PBP1A family penicillin-binding protein [Candidatus Cloacimonetes bacterium]|nr:PBP1A family penicillin-binding protein [Candidatus Cloacimonadota bacterium]